MIVWPLMLSFLCPKTKKGNEDMMIMFLMLYIQYMKVLCQNPTFDVIIALIFCREY